MKVLQILILASLFSLQVYAKCLANSETLEVENIVECEIGDKDSTGGKTFTFKYNPLQTEIVCKIGASGRACSYGPNFYWDELDAYGEIVSSKSADYCLKGEMGKHYQLRFAFPPNQNCRVTYFGASFTKQP